MEFTPWTVSLMDRLNNSVKLAGSRAFPLVVGLDFGCPFHLMVPESETNKVL